MDSRVFSADKAVLGVMAFAFGLFFEVHLAIWWVSRSNGIDKLALLLAMGTIVVLLLSVVGWYILKILLLLQAGRVSLRENKESNGESRSRAEWWLTTLKLYFYVVIVIAASGALAGLLFF